MGDGRGGALVAFGIDPTYTNSFFQRRIYMKTQLNLVS